MGVDVTFTWRGPELAGRMREAVVDGLNAAAERLLTLSLERVPVQSGDLRQSGSVRTADGVSLRAEVVFTMFYAVHVHEGVGMHFSQTKNSRAQAKYLEEPAISHRQELEKILQAYVRRALT